MKKDEAQERLKTPESPASHGTPDAGTTQELSRAEILAFLERTKKEGPDPEPHRSERPPTRPVQGLKVPGR
jgi:hypothetical protein